MTTATDQRTQRGWKLIHTIRNGHRIYFDSVSKRYALGDNSGVTPDHTDDGALWLDTDSPIRVEWYKSSGSAVVIPLLNDDGLPARTGETFEGALWIAHRFKMAVETPEDTYRVTKAGLTSHDYH